MFRNEITITNITHYICWKLLDSTEEFAIRILNITFHFFLPIIIIIFIYIMCKHNPINLLIDPSNLLIGNNVIWLIHFNSDD